MSDSVGKKKNKCEDGRKTDIFEPTGCSKKGKPRETRKVRSDRYKDDYLKRIFETPSEHLKLK